MRLCVFAGANSGRLLAYRNAAAGLGAALAAEGIELVYGGGCNGLMGVLADAALANRGTVIGVIPQSFADRGGAHAGLNDLYIVRSMHERKALMADLSDGFVALPGGIGTLEELFEIWTWSQLSHHSKPCALLNVEGFYDGLFTFLDHVVAEAFLKPIHRSILIVETEPRQLLSAIGKSLSPPVVGHDAAPYG